MPTGKVKIIDRWFIPGSTDLFFKSKLDENTQVVNYWEPRIRISDEQYKLIGAKMTDLQHEIDWRTKLMKSSNEIC